MTVLTKQVWHNALDCEACFVGCTWPYHSYSFKGNIYNVAKQAPWKSIRTYRSDIPTFKPEQQYCWAMSHSKCTINSTRNKWQFSRLAQPDYLLVSHSLQGTLQKLWGPNRYWNLYVIGMCLFIIQAVNENWAFQSLFLTPDFIYLPIYQNIYHLNIRIKTYRD